MPGAVRVNDTMRGSVGHHSNHIIGWNEYEDEEGNVERDPIYCSGHSVQGQQEEGSTKVLIEGRPAARIGDQGTSNCACDGRGYTIEKGSTKVFIEGRAAARIGDSVDIHGEGSGSLTSGSSKIIIGG